MDTGLLIALRYLFAKKSHNVINVISAVSALGMAIGTAALILILSVYNGFDRIIEANMSEIDPDILVTSSSGRRFIADEAMLDTLSALPYIAHIDCVLQDNIFLSYADKQGSAIAKGVDAHFEASTPLRDHLTAGQFELHFGEVQQAVVGAGLAYEMGINPRFKDRLSLYYPRTKSRIMLKGVPPINSAKLTVAGLFGIGTEADKQLIIVPIEIMRELLDERDALSAIEIRMHGKLEKWQMAELTQIFGSEYELRDRYMQNSAVYKMMRYEKLAIYMILIFVVLIVAFNIFGSLSMLRIEKEEDTQMLRAMGARDSLLSRIFIFEGWLVSLLGLLVGLVIGLGFALAQEHLGIVKMPSGFFVDAYPCVVKLLDVLWTIIGVAAIGFFVSLAAVRSSKTAS